MAKKTAKKSGDIPKVRITLVKSPIGFDRTQGATVQGMGLRDPGAVRKLRGKEEQPGDLAAATR